MPGDLGPLTWPYHDGLHHKKVNEQHIGCKMSRLPSLEKERVK